MKAKYYFECHVTIEPIFDERLEEATEIAKSFHFSIADLLMKKRQTDLEERSRNDTFMTSRHKEVVILQNRMIDLVRELQGKGFKVWRYKIEDPLQDSKIHDDLNLLNNCNYTS